MDVIKRQLKDFWSYFRLCRWGFNQAQYKRSYLPLIFAVVAGTMITFIQTGITEGGSGVTFNLWWFMLVGASLGMGLATSLKPTLLSVAPFTPKQRVVFSYLTIALQTLMFTVIYVVSVLAFMAFIALVFFIFRGENIFVVSDDPEFTSAVIFYSVNGKAMQILFMLLNTFAVYAATNLERYKSRCWALAGFYVGYEILTLALINGCSRALGGTHFRFGGDVWFWSDSLSDPWLITVILAVLVVIAFALSLLLSIRRHKSDNI